MLSRLCPDIRQPFFCWRSDNWGLLFEETDGSPVAPLLTWPFWSSQEEKRAHGAWIQSDTLDRNLCSWGLSNQGYWGNRSLRSSLSPQNCKMERLTISQCAFKVMRGGLLQCISQICQAKPTGIFLIYKSIHIGMFSIIHDRVLDTLTVYSTHNELVLYLHFNKAQL